MNKGYFLEKAIYYKKTIKFCILMDTIYQIISLIFFKGVYSKPRMIPNVTESYEVRRLTPGVVYSRIHKDEEWEGGVVTDLEVILWY